jgi:hypothetical protein
MIGITNASGAGSIGHDDTLNKNGNPDFLHITQEEKDNFVTASDFVEDFISNATDILYADLLTLIANNELIPSLSYRITDYTTTTIQADTQSAGHDFDIIVTALSTNELSENAKCVRKSGDTYFENAKLEAWEIKYCFNNDTSRFAWADSVNGKGVIYYMKDEWGNECSYDFKNIQYLKNDVWVYTFGGTTDNSLTGGCHHNTMMGYVLSSVLTLNFNTFGVNCFSNTFGVNCYSNTFGVNCHNNTFGNDCHSNTFGDICYSNTFGDGCSNNTFGDGCYYNMFGNNCHSNTFDEGCNSNTFGNRCDSNNFGYYCNYNTFGDECNSNTFGYACNYNTFGNNCNYNTFGNACNYNTFGSGCYNNNFDNNCGSNTFANFCYYNTFGNYCDSNTFGNNCYENSFYTGTSGTIKKDYIRYIVLEDGCKNNNFYSNVTTSNNNFLQRIRIKGLDNATQTDIQITLPTTGAEYEWVIAKNSSGIIEQYCPEDHLMNNQTYKIEDTSVSTWSSSTAYAGYGYQAQINIDDLTESDIVSVTFAGVDAISGNYYPTIQIYDGYILLFSKVNTTITIPTIEITKINL